MTRGIGGPRGRVGRMRTFTTGAIAWLSQLPAVRDFLGPADKMPSRSRKNPPSRPRSVTMALRLFLALVAVFAVTQQVRSADPPTTDIRELKLRDWEPRSM